MRRKLRVIHNFSKRLGALLLSFAILATSSQTAMAADTMPLDNVGRGNHIIETNFPIVFNSSFEEEMNKEESLGNEGNWLAISNSGRTRKEAFEGQYSAILSKDNKEITQEITGLVKGMTYTLSFMAKKSEENDSSFKVGVSGYGSDERKLLIHSTDWEEYILDFTYTGNENPVIFATTDEASKTEVYIDAISLGTKGSIKHLEVSNGLIEIFYNSDNENSINIEKNNNIDEDKQENGKGSFTAAASVNGSEYEMLALTKQEEGSDKDIFTFDAFKKGEKEQEINIRLSHHKEEVLQADYNSTNDYILTYTIPGFENPVTKEEVAITSHVQKEAAVVRNSVSISAEETTAENLILNPGFEEEMTNVGTAVGALVGNWNRYLGSSGASTVADRTSEVKRTGNYAGVITANGGAIEQDIDNLQGGNTYIFEAYVKLSDGATGTSFILGAKNYATGNQEQKKTVNSTEWTKLSVEFTYQDTTRPARVYLYAETVNGAKVYIDDTSLVEKVDINTDTDTDTDISDETEGGNTYYVSNEGNDNNNGISEGTSFATIDKLNSMTFRPGDKILFKKGDTFTGWFKPKGSGREGAPIIIASYGEGDVKPKLQPGDNNETSYVISGDNYQANARFNYVIQFVNVEYWEVRDLEIVDPKGAWDRSVYRSGITIQANDTLNPTELILDHFIIDNCNIHGFHGPLTNLGKTSGGITMNVITNSSRNKAQAKKMQINGIQITNNEIWDVGRSGINFLNPWSDRQEAAKWGTGLGNQKGYEWTPYEDFVLRNNYIHDVDGDGAIIDNTLNAIVEYNLVHDCVKNLDGNAPFAVGMFNWNATNTTFQYNEVFDINYGGGHFAQDCQGIEIDAWNDTTYVQYNYLHDNRGGFMMFCTHNQNEGDKSGLRSYNNIVRYNISQNDYAHPEMAMFNLGEWNIGSQIYNNTLYFTERALYTGKKYDGAQAYGNAEVGQFYMFQSIGGKKIIQFYNNIFYYDYKNTSNGEKATVNTFGDEHIDWRSNIFYGFANQPIDDDPNYPNIHLDDDDADILTNPGKAGEGTYVAGKERLGYQTDLSAYHLPEGSPAINRGIYIEDNGGKDYFGNPVTGIPDIGAHETGSVVLKVLSQVYNIDQENRTITVPGGDFATVDDLLGNLIYEEQVEIQLLRDGKALTEYVIVEDGDRLQVVYEGEAILYTIQMTVGESPVKEYIPVEYLVATSGSEETTSEQQQATKALDGDPRTFWHTAWSGSTQEQHWINLEVTRPYKITGYEYTPRLGGSASGAKNGLIREYEILTSTNGNDWIKQAEGNNENQKAWPATHSVKTVMFDKAVEATHVRLKSLAGENNNATAAELRLFGIPVYNENVKPETPVLTEGPNGRTKIRINWQTPEDDSGIREYVLKSGDEVIARLGGKAMYYDVADLQPDTEYSFTLTAIDKAGNESDPASITTRTTKEDGPVQYTLTFDPKNGQETEVIILEEGKALVMPESPVLEGAEFSGWYTVIEGTEVIFDGTMEITGNLYIYGKWIYPFALSEENVYWVYNVSEDGQGGYAPNYQRVLFDNGGERANAGYMNTANTMFSATMPDEQLRRRLLKSAWQFEPVDEEEGAYYLQNGFTYGYGGSTEAGSNGVATVAGGQKEKYLVKVEEVTEDGKQYVSIQSVTRKASGQPSYLKAQNTTPTSDTTLSVTFGARADVAENTLWYIGEGYSLMDWDNGVYVWRTARGNEHFRIPALATANDGDVIAVGDLRYNHNGDLGGGHEIDILRKIRPYDAAKKTYGSFGSELNITKSFRNSNEGYGDAAIVADRESDEVLILAAYGTEGYGGNNKASRILSTDGGETFGTGIDISGQIRALNPNIHSFFFGSGRIMQSRYIKVGTHYRIYSAILGCTSEGTSTNVNYVLYSDDFGLTWKILGNTSVIENTNGNRADEAKIEELPNGDVVINSRNGNNPGRYMNVFSYATNPDGTKDYESGSWEASKTKQVYEGGDITSQGTNGELITVFAKKKDGTYTHLLLQSLPSSQAPIPSGQSNTNRNAVTIWYKEVENVTVDDDITATELASTWKKGRVVQDKQSAYSTMAIQADGTMGFFYEDSMTWYDLIYYNFTLEEMTAAQGSDGDYQMAFKGIGSRKLPYEIDNQEKAIAYRDIFGAEKVNWSFNEEALEALLPISQEKNVDGEILAEGWKKIKDGSEEISVSSEMTEEDVISLLAEYTGEKIALTKAGEFQVNASGEGASSEEDLSKVTLAICMAYENTTATVEVTLAMEVKEVTTYTVSYNSMGGSSVSSNTVEEGQEVMLPVPPTKEGFTFGGWFTKENGQGEEFSGGIITENITVYAYWIEKTVSGQDIPQDIGQVLPEDVPEDGIIPEGIWVAGVVDKKYTGTKQVQNFRVYDHKKMLKEKVDYIFSYKNNQNGYEYSQSDFDKFMEELSVNPASKGYGEFEAKKAPQIVLKMKGNYTKNVSVYFRIMKPDIGDENIFITDNLYATFNNKKQTPSPLIIWTEGGKTLKLNKDFTVKEYDDNKKLKDVFKSYVEEGYDLTLLGKGSFKGERKIKLYLTKDASEIALNNATVKLEYTSVPFDGSEKKPSVSRMNYKKETLIQGTHYEIAEYSNNVSAGTASLLLRAIEGSGYTGTKRITFTIAGMPMSKVKINLPKTGYPYAGEEIRPLELQDDKGNNLVNVTFTAKGGSTQTLEEGTHYIVEYEKNVIKGTGNIILRGIAEGGFTGEKKQSFKITAASLSKEGDYTYTVSGSNMTGDGKEEAYTIPVSKGGASPKVSIIYKDDVARPLEEGVDYTVVYPKNKVPGNTVIRIKGKGNFMGTVEIPITIIPKNNQEHVEDGEEITIDAKDKVYSGKKNGWKTSFKVVDRDGKALSAKEGGIRQAQFYLIKVPEGSNLIPSLETPLSQAVVTDIPAGSVIMIVTTLSGSYQGKATGTYRILKEGKDISKAKIQIHSQEYTGEEIEVKDEMIKLAVLKSMGSETQLFLEDKDGNKGNIEVVSYEKNIKKGTAKLTFRGREEAGFGGTKTVTFKITARSVWKENWKGSY